MRFARSALLAAVAAMVPLAGCTTPRATGGRISSVSGTVVFTPQGTGTFVEIGSTRIQVRVPGGAVTVPTTFRIGQVAGKAELIAPLPSGRILVGGLNFFGAALNQGVPVEFRVPVALTLPAGTPLQVFAADDRLAPLRFVPVLGPDGNALFTQVQPDNRIPLATGFLGQFIFATVP